MRARIKVIQRTFLQIFPSDSMDLITLIFVLAAAVTFNEADKVRYDGYKVLRIVPQDKYQLFFIRDMRYNSINLDFWTEARSVNNSVDVMVRPHFVIPLINLLQSLNIPNSIIIHDVQNHQTVPKLYYPVHTSGSHPLDEIRVDEIIARKVLTLIQHETAQFDTRGTESGSFTWDKYHRIADIHQYLDQLAAAHSDIAKVISIGESYEGRPLKVMKIGKPKETSKPAIWIDAGIHAREWIAPAAAMYIIYQLVTNYANNSELVDEVDWYILPCVNPDGYEYSHTMDRMWRKTRSIHSYNCPGTDGNRNFPYHWNEGGSSSNVCSDEYHGPRPLSEPETKSMADFIIQEKNKIKVYLSFHSYGQMWVSPWGYTSRLPVDYNDLVSLAKKAANNLYSVYGTSYRIGTSTNVLYVASGGSDDWAKGVAGIKYAYTVELRDSGRHGFHLPPHLIKPTVVETWEAIKVVGKDIPNFV